MIKTNADQVVQKYHRPCLFYDETCPLCIRFKQSLERLSFEETIHFYPIQDKNIFVAFPALCKEQVHKEIHFTTSSDTVLRGTDVITHLAKINPLVNKFSWLVESKMGQKAIDLFYKSSNKYRETLRKRCCQCND